jgi:hypothetical protein
VRSSSVGFSGGGKRTMGQFHRGVVTTYALEVGVAADCDNRGQSPSAFLAARCSIHCDYSALCSQPAMPLGFDVRNRQHEKWQAAIEALILVAEKAGPYDVAAHRHHEALHRNVVWEFKTDRKDMHWGRRKLARDRQ